MATQRLGIIMNGVTGRMGTNQHLVRSIVAIRDQGGVALRNGDRVMPDPILVGRNEDKLERAGRGARRQPLSPPISTRRWPTRTTRSSSTPPPRRCAPRCSRKAIAAGKHIYCEKPVATNLDEALGIVRKAKAAGVKHGVVQDKLFLPGLLKLKLLIDAGLLRPHPVGARRVRLLGVRGRPGSRRSARRGTIASRGRRRHHPRHALPLALRARQPVRQRAVGVLPRRDPHPRAHRRDRASATRPPPTTPPTPPSSSTAASSRTSTARGRRACAATTCSRCTSTARTARPWPGCSDCRHPAARRHAEAGVEPRRQAADRLLRAAGSRCPRRRPSTTASSCSGKPSSATSSKARPSSGTCSKAPRACSWSSARCAAGRSAAGSTCRRWRLDGDKEVVRGARVRRGAAGGTR